MRRGMRWAWGLLALAVLLAGCKFKRVEDEKTISIRPKDVQPVMEVPGFPKDMDVTVTATTSPATPVTLYLVAKDDVQQAMQELVEGRDSPKILARSGQGETPTLVGIVPANKDCQVVVGNGGQTTEVKTKIVGKY